MSPLNLSKVKEIQSRGELRVGTVYRRTRPNPDTGQTVQRAEVRFDDVAGCLRTPAGGSSRQIILIVEGKSIRSRLLSSREAARLMGVPETYPVPANYNEAYHLLGDGVAVPAVEWLAGHLLTPLAQAGMELVAA
jgi:DNA (cytosine-5)-methyltransferase 1